MSNEEANSLYKCTVSEYHALYKWDGGGSPSALEPEVTESGEFYAVNDEIRRWLSLSEVECQRFVEDGVLNEFDMMCQLRVLFPLHFFVFKQTASHLAAEINMEQVFSRAGQLSEVNLDPDALVDMVSIMVNKHAYKPSLQDVMDKYYELFRGKNHPNKTDFFNRTEDSDTDA
jgi:hypothetical protein